MHKTEPLATWESNLDSYCNKRDMATYLFEKDNGLYAKAHVLAG